MRKLLQKILKNTKEEAKVLSCIVNERALKGMGTCLGIKDEFIIWLWS